MIKICYITHLPNLNGASRSLLDLLDGLDRNKFKPYVLLNGHGPIEIELEKRNVNIKIIRYAPSTNSDNIVKNTLKYIFNSGILNRIIVGKIVEFFRKEKIDIVHNNTLLVSVGMEAARKAHIPYICHIREFVWEDHHRVFFHPNRVYSLINDAFYVIAITDAVKNKFQKDIRKSIIVLRDGIHTKHYLLPLKKILNNSTTNILLAGRITPGKGQLEAIKAVKKVHENGYDIRLTLLGTIGDRSYFSEIDEFLKDNKLNYIKIKNFANDLRDIRSNMDIGLTCSAAEGLGRVTIENMLSSILVIAVDTAGTKEIISDRDTGYLYKKGEINELSTLIEYAINHKMESNNIVKKAYFYAQEEFDYLKYTKNIMELYQKMGERDFSAEKTI